MQVPGKLVLVKAQLQPSAAGPAHGPLKEEIHGVFEEPSDHYEANSFSEFLGSWASNAPQHCQNILSAIDLNLTDPLIDVPLLKTLAARPSPFFTCLDV